MLIEELLDYMVRKIQLVSHKCVLPIVTNTNFSYISKKKLLFE